ncbi:hypothetical protein [Occallatibacter savannae]|uniref:hypothetical protein n=1 Tax=Occallatibacter savannae TaxID=1002691 RepID=UPI0013A5AECB|nr:hypothetical protein [Occallatibacter savannae]
MRSFELESAKPRKLSGNWLRGLCLAAAFTVPLTGLAQDGKPPADNAKATAPASDPKASQADAAKDAKPASAAPNDKKKQIADESAELLNMALALKAEVDKTTKDTLSLNVIKKADQIEKLAKSVKDKMKQSSGS